MLQIRRTIKPSVCVDVTSDEQPSPQLLPIAAAASGLPDVSKTNPDYLAARPAPCPSTPNPYPQMD